MAAVKTLMYPLRTLHGDMRSRARSLVGWVRVDLIGIIPPWWMGEAILDTIDPAGREWR
jgi:hypothetical protein